MLINFETRIQYNSKIHRTDDVQLRHSRRAIRFFVEQRLRWLLSSCNDSNGDVVSR